MPLNLSGIWTFELITFDCTFSEKSCYVGLVASSKPNFHFLNIMKDSFNVIDRLYRLFLSEKTKERSEKVIISIAIVSFLLHLGLILFKDLMPGVLRFDSELFNNPISAIYTPFSFILVYEVYLLVYYLPKSISLYISKQYEIITLVIIRRIFKDLSNLDLNSNWFDNSYDLQLTFDLVTTILLFGLILLFNKLNQNRKKVRCHG